MGLTRIRHCSPLRSAEFFAGIGLVRVALETEGFRVVWANDIDRRKREIYAANFGDSEFVLEDIRRIRGSDVPQVDLATASFPCTDLSLAGCRAGLAGRESSMFWEFARVIEEMGPSAPRVVLLENVPGFASSHDGRDLAAAVARLNELGYCCDLFVANARWFAPQSRLRLFIVGSLLAPLEEVQWKPSPTRPKWLCRFVERNAGLRIRARNLPVAPRAECGLADIVERCHPADRFWWEEGRMKRFLDSLSPLQERRLADLKRGEHLTWRTAYRRTRGGRSVWEIRADDVAGCLRTARGGSSKQALIEVGQGCVRARWMTPREYARLQGSPETFMIDSVRPSDAYFGFGDAVCVPVIAWISRECLAPIFSEHAESAIERVSELGRAVVYA